MPRRGKRNSGEYPNKTGTTTARVGYRDLSPYVTFGPVPAAPETRMLIEQAGGRKLASTSYGAALFPARVGTYVFMPTLNTTFDVLAAPTNNLVSGLKTYWLSLYQELLAQMVRDRIPVTNAAFSVTATDVTSFLTNIGVAYANLRALQQLLSCPSYNIYIGTAIQTVAANEITLKGLLKALNAFGVPPLYREILDKVFGVFAPEPSGPVILAFAGDAASFAGGTLFDPSSSSSMTTMLSMITNALANVRNSANQSIIAGIFFSAYGGAPIGPIGPNGDQRCYDMWMFQNFAVYDTVAAKVFAHPNGTSDATNRVPLFVRRNTWRDGDLVALIYSSLWRPKIASINNNVAIATYEGIGLAVDSVVTTAATVVGWISEQNATFNTITSTQAAASTGITETDPITYGLPFSIYATFENTNYVGLRLPWPDIEIVETSINEIADATYYLINSLMGTGYRGGTFTPTKNW